MAQHADPKSSAAEGDTYIDRDGARAIVAKGEPALFTNISQDPSERREFWDHVEAHEAKPSPDKLELSVAINRSFWNTVADDEECPKPLRDAIRTAGSDDPVKLTTGDNKPVRKLLKKHGWSKTNPRGARFIDGRGGRVQYRIVCELPHETDHAARVRIMQDFCQYFEDRRLPFLAVMHAPDHHNDERNWHFHLIFHDRPAKRFTCRAEDHLWSLEAGASADAKRKYDIAQQALADPAVQAQTGQWDFTVAHRYQKPSGGWKATRPFQQPKDRSCNSKDFLTKLRAMLADLTNRELAAAEVERRVDPRSFKKMGIAKAPDVHLGTKASALEAAGVPTAAGRQNEENQWRYLQTISEEKHRARGAEIGKQAEYWKRDIAKAKRDAGESESALRGIDDWAASKRAALEHLTIVEDMTAHIERLRSRAEKEIRVAKRQLLAIENGKASKLEAQRNVEHEAIMREAEDHLAGLSAILREEMQQMENSKAIAARLEQAAAATMRKIERQMEVPAPSVMPTAVSSNPHRARDEHIIEVMRKHHVVPDFNWDEDDLVLEFHNRAVLTHGLPKHVQIRDKRSSDRIEGVIMAQLRHTRRLLAFAQSQPGKVLFENGGQSFRFSSDAPAELVEMALAYSREPRMIARMKALLQKGREIGAATNRPTPEHASLFDEWTKADRAGDVVVRRSLSQRIRADEKLRSRLDRLGPEMARAIKDDWQATDAQNAMLAARQSGMGF